MRFPIIAGLILSGVLPFYGASAHAAESAWLPAEAAAVLSVALTNNPALAAARSAWTAETQRAVAFDGFYQPRVLAAAGANRGPAEAPESGLPLRLPGDAASAQAGVLFPLRVGARLGAGVAQRYLYETDGFEDQAQSVAGLRLEVPLWRDRGFRTQRLGQAAAEAVAEGTREALAGARQNVARDTLVAFANWLYAAADLREAEQAAERVESLRSETAARVELRATPEYQLFPAQMEVAFRQDELRQAQALRSSARHALEALLGAPTPLAEADPALLRRWAERCATAEVAQVLGAAVATRPEMRQAQRVCEAADRLTDVAREQVRSDLSLAAGAGYQTENEDGGFGNENIVDDRRAGVEAALVWSRPFTFDAEAASLRARDADAEVARAELRRIGLLIGLERAQAETALAAARDRLGYLDRAVLEARRTLTAEEDRLRLGEGRSRNVLDAQKDLTTAERLANLAAFETVRAFAQLLHATGVPLASEENNDVHLSPAF
ncbi:MAG: TolC family protein [Kiritimatiellae bacterium]|nr:TolC family protein [Kiritimatiellia bacterium]